MALIIRIRGVGFPLRVRLKGSLSATISAIIRIWKRGLKNKNRVPLKGSTIRAIIGALMIRIGFRGYIVL